MSDTLSHEEIAVLVAARDYKAAHALAQAAFANPEQARTMRARILDDKAHSAGEVLKKAALALP